MPSNQEIDQRLRQVTDQLDDGAVGAEELLRALVEIQTDGICVVSADGRVIYASSSFAATLGYESGFEMKGLEVHDFTFNPVEHRKIFGRWQQARTSLRMDARNVLKAKRKDGSPIELQIGVVPRGNQQALVIVRKV